MTSYLKLALSCFTLAALMLLSCVLPKVGCAVLVLFTVILFVAECFKAPTWTNDFKHCPWCKGYYPEDQPDKIYADAPKGATISDSHGICSHCYAKQVASIPDLPVDKQKVTLSDAMRIRRLSFSKRN